jgi:hypothetical protein
MYSALLVCHEDADAKMMLCVRRRRNRNDNVAWWIEAAHPKAAQTTTEKRHRSLLEEYCISIYASLLDE